MSDQSEPESAERVEAPGKAPLKSGLAPLLTTAAVALVAGAVGGVAVAGLWHPSSDAPATFSESQVSDAKQDLCAAALLARQAVAKNMHLVNPEPDNPIGQLAVAANARLAVIGGAAYLRGRLEADPAAPQDVVDAARAMAGALEQLNVSYLVGQSDSEHEQLGRDLDARIADLGTVCG